MYRAIKISHSTNNHDVSLFNAAVHRNNKQILCLSALKLIPAYRNNLWSDSIAHYAFIYLYYIYRATF